MDKLALSQSKKMIKSIDLSSLNQSDSTTL